MSNENENANLVNIVSTAIKIPGVRVNRTAFLLEAFENESENMKNKILKVGPVAAGCSRARIRKLAEKYVDKRTLTSSGASFISGIPGGLAMAATIPADTLQFFGVALRLAQEIAYLYGAENFWENGQVDTSRVRHQLILYCGVMFGVSGASATLRVVSSALGKQALKKIPQMALTKTFYYPIIKAIAKAVGARMTKGLFAKGVSKAVPLFGGVFSGIITYATMHPMGMRLIDEFDEIRFDYTKEEFKEDWEDITEKFDIEEPETVAEEPRKAEKSCAEQLKEAKELLDMGIISQEEFNALKEKLLARM